MGNAYHLAHHQLADVEGLWSLLGEEVEALLHGGTGVGDTKVLVAVVELRADVVEGDALVAQPVPLQLLSKSIQVKVLQTLRTLQDLLQSACVTVRKSPSSLSL